MIRFRGGEVREKHRAVRVEYRADGDSLHILEPHTGTDIAITRKEARSDPRWSQRYFTRIAGMVERLCNAQLR